MSRAGSTLTVVDDTATSSGAPLLLAGDFPPPVVIQPGRCYVLLTLRNNQGTFLAFAAPDTKIPPGQLVRMNTPAGAKLRGRIFYLVPIQTDVELVPVNTVSVVAVHVEDSGPQVSITLVDTPVPNLTVIFTVHL